MHPTDNRFPKHKIMHCLADQLSGRDLSSEASTVPSTKFIAEISLVLNSLKKLVANIVENNGSCHDILYMRTMYVL